MVSLRMLSCNFSSEFVHKFSAKLIVRSRFFDHWEISISLSDIHNAVEVHRCNFRFSSKLLSKPHDVKISAWRWRSKFVLSWGSAFARRPGGTIWRWVLTAQLNGPRITNIALSEDLSLLCVRQKTIDRATDGESENERNVAPFGTPGASTETDQAKIENDDTRFTSPKSKKEAEDLEAALEETRLNYINFSIWPLPKSCMPTWQITQDQLDAYWDTDQKSGDPSKRDPPKQVHRKWLHKTGTLGSGIELTSNLVLTYHSRYFWCILWKWRAFHIGGKTDSHILEDLRLFLGCLNKVILGDSWEIHEQNWYSVACWFCYFAPIYEMQRTCFFSPSLISMASKT